MLKMQLQPHFLCNTLNAIYHQAAEDSGKAQQCNDWADSCAYRSITFLPIRAEAVKGNEGHDLAVTGSIVDNMLHVDSVRYGYNEVGPNAGNNQFPEDWNCN